MQDKGASSTYNSSHFLLYSGCGTPDRNDTDVEVVLWNIFGRFKLDFID